LDGTLSHFILYYNQYVYMCVYIFFFSLNNGWCICFELFLYKWYKLLCSVFRFCVRTAFFSSFARAYFTVVLFVWWVSTYIDIELNITDLKWMCIAYRDYAMLKKDRSVLATEKKIQASRTHKMITITDRSSTTRENDYVIVSVIVILAWKYSCLLWY
jgi:hypothetical protein